jgi:hypothetical protein
LPEQIHRIKGENMPEAEALRFAEEIAWICSLW